MLANVREWCSSQQKVKIMSDVTCDIDFVGSFRQQGIVAVSRNVRQSVEGYFAAYQGPPFVLKIQVLTVERGGKANQPISLREGREPPGRKDALFAVIYTQGSQGAQCLLSSTDFNRDQLREILAKAEQDRAQVTIREQSTEAPAMAHAHTDEPQTDEEDGDIGAGANEDPSGVTLESLVTPNTGKVDDIVGCIAVLARHLHGLCSTESDSGMYRTGCFAAQKELLSCGITSHRPMLLRYLQELGILSRLTRRPDGQYNWLVMDPAFVSDFITPVRAHAVYERMMRDNRRIAQLNRKAKKGERAEGAPTTTGEPALDEGQLEEIARLVAEHEELGEKLIAAEAHSAEQDSVIAGLRAQVERLEEELAQARAAAASRPTAKDTVAELLARVKRAT